MAAGQTTGDSGAQEVALEVLAEPVLAVQDRVVPPAELRRGPVAHEVFEQPFGLGRLVGERIRAHVVLGLPLGRELLVEELGILGQETAGGFEDLV